METLQLERARRDEDGVQDCHYPHHSHLHAAAASGQRRREEKSSSTTTTRKHRKNRKNRNSNDDDDDDDDSSNNSSSSSSSSSRSDEREDGGEELEEGQAEREGARRLAHSGNPSFHNNTNAHARHFSNSSTTTTHIHTTTATENGGDGGRDHYSAPISREDLRRLRLENRNMHLLLVENRELKKQAREESARAESGRRELAAELDRSKGELLRVSRELRVVGERLQLLQGGAVSRCAKHLQQEWIDVRFLVPRPP